MEKLLVELHLNHRRLARDHERLAFAINMSRAIAQNQANAGRAVFEIRRGEESSLTGFLVRQEANFLDRAEREERSSRDDQRISFDSKHRITRTNQPRTQQGARSREE